MYFYCKLLDNIIVVRGHTYELHVRSMNYKGSVLKFPPILK